MNEYIFEDFINDSSRYPKNQEIAHMSKDERMKELKGMIWYHKQIGTSKKDIIEDLMAYTFTYEELQKIGFIKKGE